MGAPVVLGMPVAQRDFRFVPFGAAGSPQASRLTEIMANVANPQRRFAFPYEPHVPQSMRSSEVSSRTAHTTALHEAVAIDRFWLAGD